MAAEVNLGISPFFFSKKIFTFNFTLYSFLANMVQYFFGLSMSVQNLEGNFKCRLSTIAYTFYYWIISVESVTIEHIDWFRFPLVSCFGVCVCLCVCVYPVVDPGFPRGPPTPEPIILQKKFLKLHENKRIWRGYTSLTPLWIRHWYLFMLCVSRVCECGACVFVCVRLLDDRTLGHVSHGVEVESDAGEPDTRGRHGTVWDHLHL